MNKPSYINHYKIGYTQKVHRGRNIVTSLNSVPYQNFISNLNFTSFKKFQIPAGMGNRADLISNYFYGTPTNDWLICSFNNIKDPFNELNVGDIILIPNINF